MVCFHDMVKSDDASIPQWEMRGSVELNEVKNVQDSLLSSVRFTRNNYSFSRSRFRCDKK